MTAHGMADIAVSILRWVDDDPQPGIVEFSLLDNSGRDWRFVDKQAVVSPEPLDGRNAFPRPGCIRCSILSFRFDDAGHDIAEIDTGLPWGIEAVDGTHVFRVAAERLDRNVPKAGETETVHAVETVVFTATRE